ncbi:oil body-associated protein 2C-like [Camellia sinensis]|uniref:oil body-associated protein 2C-like n=1 Tax=Camellia sinensis TaxID=4442 RepID=UPI001036AA12|nr:oil body-associated protein 2C-like [Camellia sinensis]
MSSNEELVRQKDEADGKVGDLQRELEGERTKAVEEKGRLQRELEAERVQAVAEKEILKKELKAEKAKAASERAALQKELDEERAKAASKRVAYPDLCVTAVEQFKGSTEFQTAVDAAVARNLAGQESGGTGPSRTTAGGWVDEVGEQYGSGFFLGCGEYLEVVEEESEDLTRQIETHHYLTRLNQDFIQCGVYDTDDSHSRLIGVEYIITDRIFETLPPDEQKLWHCHAYEIKSGLWVNPQVPELVLKPELENLTKAYGKFWCTWQVDRGKFPLGPPSLMMSPQPMNLGKVRPHLVEKRDWKYRISVDDLKMSRVEIEEPEWINPQADYWKQHGKGFVVLIEPIEMKKMAPFS